MVLTVTLNAALDVTYELEHVEWGEANRVARVHARAGGKGINVARTLQQLGREALVCGPAGGPTGDAVRADLDAAGLPHALSPLGGESRRTVAVVSRGHGHTTLLSEPGPDLAADEWEALHGEVAARAAAVEWAVLSGSVPPGAPEDVYGILAATCAEQGAQAVVDASGPALVAALAAARRSSSRTRASWPRRSAARSAGPPTRSRAPRSCAAAARGRSSSRSASTAPARSPTRVRGTPRCRAPRATPTGAGDALVALPRRRRAARAPVARAAAPRRRRRRGRGRPPVRRRLRRRSAAAPRARDDGPRARAARRMHAARRGAARAARAAAGRGRAVGGG